MRMPIRLLRVGIGLFALWSLGYIATQFTMSGRPPPIPEPTYSPEFVQEICAVFAISPDDHFCSDLTLTADAVSLTHAVRRTYSTDRTMTYADLQPLLAQIGERSWCLGSAIVEGCPPPDDCTRLYTCTVEYALPTGENLRGYADFFENSLTDIGIYRRGVESR